MSKSVGAQQWKPYPAYKSSGVEWLGQVPEGWELRRLKFSVENINLKCLEDEIDTPFVALEHIESWTGKLYLNEDSKSDGQPNKYEANDVLFCKLRPYLAKVHLAKAHGVCTSELLVLRPVKEIVSEFLYRFLLSRDVINQITASTYGAKMPRVNWEFIGNLPLPVPLEKEQQAIAAFLDHECTRVDALIAKKRRLLEFLEEKRRAVITQAVTRGLDPDAPMKDSGVEWLGQVPEGWEVFSLQQLCEEFKAGPFGSSLTKDMYSDSGYRVYGQEQVIPADFTIGDYYIDAVKFEELKQYSVNEGDILISCVGTFGKIVSVPAGIEPGIINPRIIKLRIPAKVNTSYFVYALRSSMAYHQFSLLSRGGTMDIINIGIIKKIIMPLPVYPEQQAIASYLDAATAAIDAQRQAHEKSIALLQEYRASLITHAVTGKIDVREYAPQQ